MIMTNKMVITMIIYMHYDNDMHFSFSCIDGQLSIMFPVDRNLEYPLHQNTLEFAQCIIDVLQHRASDAMIYMYNIYYF